MIAATIKELDEIRKTARQNFRVERIRANEAADWTLANGAIQHKSGGFFSVVGLRSAAEPQSEKVLLFQPQAAITGLLYTFHQEEQYFLVQARAEPGCVDDVQFGPTIQSTPANYMRLHGGAATPYAKAFTGFDPRISIRLDTTQSDLGERYFMKAKRMIVAEYHGGMEAHPGFVWVSSRAIRAALRRSTYLNIDLRGLLALAGLSNAGGRSTLLPASSAAATSLRRPVRPDVLGRLFASATPRMTSPDIVPLETIRSWTSDEWGLAESQPVQKFRVDYFKVQAVLREVGSWSQPLINSTGRGLSRLLAKRSEEGLEVLVRVAQETGLALGWGLAPTELHYPGSLDDENASSPPGRILAATTESDEGGRFFRDESAYEICLADDPAAYSGPSLHWINLAELKYLLCLSNICTIQLRGISSHLIEMDDAA